QLDGRALVPLDTIPLVPRAQVDDVVGDQSAGLSITPDGRRGFAGLRGSDQLAVLASDGTGQRVHAVGGIPTGGHWPRHHLLDGDVVHTANERSNSVVSLRLGPDGEDAVQIGETQRVASATYLLPA
ncbi:MAG: beta-propeller fold lactonase family protein, partial [Naasia sp.]